MVLFFHCLLSHCDLVFVCGVVFCQWGIKGVLESAPTHGFALNFA